jgi:UDP-N-acetylmuramoyl-tripeptide--D-alanyl-D-alanine ligase
MGKRWQLRQLRMAVWHCRVALMYAAAYVWRPLLFRTTFIAITGSVGKTTTKECLSAALAGRYPTVKSPENRNDYSGVPSSLLRVRPWHRFAVIEAAANGLRLMQRSAPLIRPDVAIILQVNRHHMKNFRTLENVAAEKAVLLAALRPSGVAVLNGDDPRVVQMAVGLKQRVVWFGDSPSFDYWGEQPASMWPSRLSFTIHAREESASVQTQLIGTHWRHSVLAAIAAAHVSGVPLRDAAAAINQVAPAPGRMQPASLSSGATMIRDDFDGSIDTMAPAFEAIACAAASRKILVMTDVSDSSSNSRIRLHRMGKEIARVFDSAVFIGDTSHHGVRGAVNAGMSSDRARQFWDWPEAAEFLQHELRKGDLVLLKGRVMEHITRLYFALLGPVSCRKVSCQKRIICDLCPELGSLIPLQPAPTPVTDIASVPRSRSMAEDSGRTHP